MSIGAPLFVCKNCITVAIEVDHPETDTIEDNCPRCGNSVFTATIKLGEVKRTIDKQIGTS